MYVLENREIAANFLVQDCISMGIFPHSHVLIPIPMHLVPIPMADLIAIPMGIPWDPWDPKPMGSHAHLYY